MFDLNNFKVFDYPDDRLMIADYCYFTRAHGPGRRMAIWVQGCFKRCPGCINQKMLPISDKFMSSDSLRKEIEKAVASKAQIEGLTIMGGEPFLQAKALYSLLVNFPQLNIIIFTGYLHSELLSFNNEYVNKLISITDVLIDGPFIKERLHKDLISGSSNQNFCFLTDRLKNADFSRKEKEQILDLGSRPSIIKTGLGK